MADLGRFGDAAKQADLNSLWTQLIAAGLAQLPPGVAPVLSLDDHGFVIEFRSANEYRVTELQCGQGVVTAADRQVRRIGLILQSFAPDATWLVCA